MSRMSNQRRCVGDAGCRAGLAHSADHVAIIHSSRDNNSSCESAAELTSSVTQSCETALVVVLDDVSLTSLQATQLSRCRYSSYGDT